MPGQNFIIYRGYYNPETNQTGPIVYFKVEPVGQPSTSYELLSRKAEELTATESPANFVHYYVDEEYL